MYYTPSQLYNFFKKNYPNVLHEQHRPKHIKPKLVVVETSKEYREKYRVEKEFGTYVSPACRPPWSNKIVFCRELINKYIKTRSKFMAEILIKHLIVHETLHIFLEPIFHNQNREMEEVEVHKIMLKNYFGRYILGHYMLLVHHLKGGIFGYPLLFSMLFYHYLKDKIKKFF